MSSKCSAASINKVVNKCIRELGPPTGNMAEYGTRLGNLVVRELRRAGVGIRGTRRVRANRALRTMLGFPAELANETIESFIYRTLRYHMDDYEPLFEGTRRNGQRYKRKIGNLMPDLLIELPDGSFIIWDLTSKTAEEHFLKTLLYARVASVASGGRLMRIGERYWHQFRGVNRFVPPP